MNKLDEELNEVVEVVEVDDRPPPKNGVVGLNPSPEIKIIYDRLKRRLVSGEQYKCMCGGRFRLTSWNNHKYGNYHTSYLRKMIELDNKYDDYEYLSKPRNFIIHKRSYTRKRGMVVLKFGFKIGN